MDFYGPTEQGLIASGYRHMQKNKIDSSHVTNKQGLSTFHSRKLVLFETVIKVHNQQQL